jgi:hypothetical protein
VSESGCRKREQRFCGGGSLGARVGVWWKGCRKQLPKASFSAALQPQVQRLMRMNTLITLAGRAADPHRPHSCGGAVALPVRHETTWWKAARLRMDNCTSQYQAIVCQAMMTKQPLSESADQQLTRSQRQSVREPFSYGGTFGLRAAPAGVSRSTPGACRSRVKTGAGTVISRPGAATRAATRGISRATTATGRAGAAV